jgi:ferredoxin
MARLEDRLSDNAPGDYFVDSSCIDCDTCRFVAPSVFARSDAHGQSVVLRQPRAEDERLRAAMALVACPTSSIGTAAKADVLLASTAFPEPLSERVYYCGYASESSYGASSYLIVREGGNVLVDSPRASKPLLKRIRELGGARYMFLSHRDDVADHAVFARELGCERLLHEADVSRGTADVEVKIARTLIVFHRPRSDGDPGPRPHPGQRRPPPRRAPLHRRPPRGRGRRRRRAPRLARRLLVLLGGADALHGAPPRTPLLVGPPGPRPRPPRRVPEAMHAKLTRLIEQMRRTR